MREFIPPASRFVNLPDGFAMKRGGRLWGARIAYETYGQLSSTGENVVLILTGLSPDAHVASSPSDPTPGWWESMVGPGKPVDTDKWFVLCINSLGSCKGSTGPATVNARTGMPYRQEFPDLSIEDIADAAAYVVHYLGLERLACVIGASMGGMTSLALLSRYPYIAHSHINICGAVHALPFSIAIRTLQREAICTDPDWSKGNYTEEKYPYQGMLTARKLGLITYRSASEWKHRFGRDKSAVPHGKKEKYLNPEFDIQNYLAGNAARFCQKFDPNSYLYLSQSIDWFELGGTPDAMSAQSALSAINLEHALILGVQTDILFPPEQQTFIADGFLKGGVNVTSKLLDSIEGHDAFLVDTHRFGHEMNAFLGKIYTGKH